jgi:hypothetical protein
MRLPEDGGLWISPPEYLFERGRDFVACETLARSPFQDRRVVDGMVIS